MARDRYERVRRTGKQIVESVTMVANANFNAVQSLSDALAGLPSLTLIHDAPACDWNGGQWSEDMIETLSRGTVGSYLGHVPGGMVRIRLSDGRERVIHPGTTKELA